MGRSAGLGAFKGLVDIGSGTPKHVDRVWAIRHQPTDMNDQLVIVTRRDPMPGRQFHELAARPDEEWIGHYDHSSTLLPCQIVEAGRKLIEFPDREWNERYPKRRSSGRQLMLCLRLGIGGDGQVPDAARFFHGFVQQLEALAQHLRREDRVVGQFAVVTIQRP